MLVNDEVRKEIYAALGEAAVALIDDGRADEIATTLKKLIFCPESMNRCVHENEHFDSYHSVARELKEDIDFLATNYCEHCVESTEKCLYSTEQAEKKPEITAGDVAFYPLHRKTSQAVNRFYSFLGYHILPEIPFKILNRGEVVSRKERIFLVNHLDGRSSPAIIRWFRRNVPEHMALIPTWQELSFINGIYARAELVGVCYIIC